MQTSRYIPADVRASLRREVHYGCPMASCGSPYLTYHHFAPTFRDFSEGQPHDPAGMIALCQTHAALADGAVYTDEQLLHAKAEPFLASTDDVRGRLDWLRREIVFAAGVLAVKPTILLQVDAKALIWVNTSSTGDMLLSMDLPDQTGETLFLMQDNDWLIAGEVEDVEVLPRGRSLKIQAPERGIRLDLGFRSLSRDEMREWVKQRAVTGAVASRAALLDHLKRRAWTQARVQEYLMSTESEGSSQADRLALDLWSAIERHQLLWPALLVTLQGKLNTFSVPIEITEHRLQVGTGNIGGSISGGSIGVHIDTGA